MPYARDNAADTMFGHLFREAEEDFLFVRDLEKGASCRTSLVRPDAGGDLVVRKALHGCVDPWARSLDQAQVEYENDVATARKLNDAADAANVALRITRLLLAPAAAPVAVPLAVLAAAPAADAKPTNPPASYWSLCNGGSMYTFIHSCREAGAVLPCGLVLHFLQQLLETLDFMYTGLEQPIVHRDLHGDNMLLHFTSRRLLPDVHVIDFGRAAPVPANLAATASPSPGPNTTRCCSDLNCTRGACPGFFWDVHAVLRALRDELLPLTFPPDKRASSRSLADEGSRHKYLLRHGESETGTTNADAADADADAAVCYRPLHRAYQLLNTANAQLIHNLAQVWQTSGSGSGGSGSGGSGAPKFPTFPSLQPALSFVRAAAARAQPSLERNLGSGGKHASFRAAVLEPARRAAIRLARGVPEPGLSASMAGLLLEGPVVPGATHAAEVDVDEGGAVLEVRRVLAGLGEREREPAGGRCGGASWRGERGDEGIDVEDDAVGDGKDAGR